MSLGAGDAAPLAFDLCPVVQHHDPEHGEVTLGIVPGSMYYVRRPAACSPATPGCARSLHVMYATERLWSGRYLYRSPRS
jgi:hypothetical protein